MSNHSNGNVQAFLDQWAQAEAGGDRQALAGLIDDEFAGVGPLGFVLPKEAWIGRHAGGLKYDDFRISETQVHEFGDAAVVTARVDQPGKHQGNPIPSAARATLMVVDRPQGKKLAGLSMTFLAGTPGAPAIPGKG